MNKYELARIFHSIGTLLELKGENPFKVQTYYKAARTVENLTEEITELIREDRLKEIPGFGAALIGKTIEWAKTGTISYYEELRQTTPPGLLELLRLPGLGPKKIARLNADLGITDLETLEAACRENKLTTLPGFGPKTQGKILAGLQFLKEHRNCFLWTEGMEWARKLQEYLAAHPKASQVEIAGDLRRGQPVADRIDLVAATTDPPAVAAALTASEFNQDHKAAVHSELGVNETGITLPNNITVHLYAAPPEKFPAVLLYRTGNHPHFEALSRLAAQGGFTLRPDGLFKGEEIISCRDEAELYRHLGLVFIPPELRENLGELEAAAGGSLPAPVRPEDLQGLFHVHTNYSDGLCSLREMVEGAIERGYHYLGIADHSQSAFYAHGLKKAALEKQWVEIDQLNREYPHFKIFKGIEADILPSGELDYDPETLAQFDFVIASVHSHFQMEEAEMTARLLKALDNPYVTMLGHPTGRLLLTRPGYRVDLEAVLEKVAATGRIIEFNANPFRLDLDWRWCRRAKELGIPIAVNPDAHSVAELDLTRTSIPVVRKGWLTKADVFNTRTIREILAYFKRKKQAPNEI
ncbi:MAG TPA: DNA polymerase/3'-5' exonuclease PolX [Capillibacterium sp.]